MLTPDVVATDHKLEEATEKSTEKLARHRWHWTLDESNPGRVSIREYARAIGRSEQPIRAIANGYDQWVRAAARTHLEDQIAKARMSTETAAAAEAVAKARGISIRQAGDGGTRYHNETRRVRDIARQRAEERGTSVEEEAPKIAETIVRYEKAAKAERADRNGRTDLRVIEIEQRLLKMRREGMLALTLVQEIEFDDDGRDLLMEALGSIKAILALIDVKLSGVSGVDWDKEMAQLGVGE